MLSSLGSPRLFKNVSQLHLLQKLCEKAQLSLALMTKVYFLVLTEGDGAGRLQYRYKNASLCLSGYNLNITYKTVKYDLVCQILHGMAKSMN
jgi:hypothetical protein